MRRITISAAALAFAGIVRGVTIVVPASPAPEEVRAAEELGHVWLRGIGETAMVRREDKPGQSEVGPWFFLGETILGRAWAALPAGMDRDGFHIVTLGEGQVARKGPATSPGGRDDGVVIRGATAVGTELGVGWYAQHAMGVRWFWPGALGEEVPALGGWQPPPLDRAIAPAFMSRELMELDGEGQAWARRNGLHGRLPHTHALLNVFPAALFDAHPDWFPLREGRRYRPASTADYNWQPNLALPEVAAHAAGVAEAFFAREPGAEGFSLSINDSICFDQSEATVRARGPLRWFRGRPDYSDLVFGFMNRVADEVARGHPDTLLSAYAYYWCENAPNFPVRANVVPWLTADRSQWYDAKFRTEDRALIERWCRSGAKVVGIYDYLYGAPFLVPRVTTRLTAESIQFAAHAGVRAYTAETNPNWAFDGPKLWVAAQLLWDPRQSVDALVDEYYRRFWREAAEPMRRFDERCERIWRGQAGPGWWIKYYQDEAQAELFPAKARAELRSDLRRAAEMARDPSVRARVKVVSAGFAVTERFAAFCEARTALARAAGDARNDGARVAALLEDFRRKREELMPVEARAVAARAMSKVDLEVYLRADPTAEVRARWGGGQVGEAAFAEDSELKDSGWSTLRAPGRLDDRTFTWSEAPWLGRGEPVEGRRIEVGTGGRERGTVIYRGCKAERLQQWVPAMPGSFYRESVRVRGEVSPGNQTYLILSWTDRQRRFVGQAVSDRLPEGDWTKGKTLEVEGQAPATAAFIGVGVFACNQTGRDYAEFSGLSLRVAESPILGAP